MANDHSCVFPEVEIGDDQPPGSPLHPGMKVLAPCVCGESCVDHVDMLEDHLADVSRALLSSEPRRALFHWAPSARRKQIVRYGLRPHMRCTTSANAEGWKAPVICLGDSPSWAWALSGDMPYTPPGEWDLWQTSLDLVTDPVVLPSTDRASGIHEIRTQHRIFKRDLWWVASRTKTQ